MQLRQAFEIANSSADNQFSASSQFDSSWMEFESGGVEQELNDDNIEAPDEGGQERFNESAAVADLLDNLTGYSDVVPPARDGQSDFEDRADWAQEYAELLEKLDLIINSPSLVVDIDQWQQLFASPLIRGHVYRVDFCLQLLAKIKERLAHDKYQHLFSPEVILCITDFIQGSISFDDAREISDKWAIVIGGLAKKTSRFINRRKARQDWKKYLFRRFVWTFFSFRGRLRRRSFFIAFVTIFMSITLYAESVNDRRVGSVEIDVAAESDLDQIAGATEADGLEVMPERKKSVDQLFPTTTRNPMKVKPYASKITDIPVPKDAGRKAGVDQVNSPQKALGISGLRALKMLMVTGFLLWATAALIVKRVHDMGDSYFGLLLLLIPYVNIGYLFRLLLGKDDDNKHGVSSANEIKNLWWFRRVVYNELQDCRAD
jgi:uncharacterized membrane protein YhaH (DUF805 family)